MKSKYQSFLFIALLFFTAQNHVCAEESPKQINNELQYEDLPSLPIDEVSKGQAATLQEPLKKLRFRSLSKEDEENESKTRTRAR